MSKAVLNSRIKEMKCNGKAIPQEYIVCFNDYIKNIIGTRVDQEIASLNKIIVEKFEIGKFKSVNELIYSYKNLEKEFTKSRQKIAELEQELAELKEKAIVPRYEIGTKLYMIPTEFNRLKGIKDYELLSISLSSIGLRYDLSLNKKEKGVELFYCASEDMFGQSIFSTLEEAQDKLKEMQGNE